MENKFVNYTVKDGILFGNYNDDLTVNLEEAKAMVLERLKFQNGKNYPVIFQLNNMKTSSKEARAYMGKDGIEGITAGAFIVNNILEKMFANIFISIEKPAVPAKFFTNLEDAIQWIKSVEKK